MANILFFRIPVIFLYNVKDWNKILSVAANKAEVVRFLVGQWKEKRFRDKVNDRILYFTEEETEEKCWKISMMAVTLVPELRWNHEKADTRMLLHAQHAGGKCVLHADDTDVLVLLLGHAHNLGKCYLKKGKGAKSRVVGIFEVADQLGRQVIDGILKQEVCKALIGLHALTRCDTVSAFAAKGKWRPLQMICQDPDLCGDNEGYWKGVEFEQ